MKRFPGLALVIAAGFALTATAAPPVQHIRGVIQSFNNHGVTVHTRAGDTVTVVLAGTTAYLDVVKSSFSRIDEGRFIGAAAKNAGNSLVALEVVVFPESMRGVGAGHRPWDKLPDTTQSETLVGTSMTNGTVTSASALNATARVQSSMTNGTVASAKSVSGGKLITVTYEGGRQTIRVPSTVPVVTLHSADKTALKQGAHVFIAAVNIDSALTARMVAVGKDGLRPPM